VFHAYKVIVSCKLRDCIITIKHNNNNHNHNMGLLQYCTVVITLLSSLLPMLVIKRFVVQDFD
jgi:hypothetical protein